jgi:outer membrane receptor protein involved in Fe transport
MNITRRIRFLSAVAVLPLLATPGIAQTTAAADTGFEEIVVTARKTTERLQDAPLAVSVVTSEKIDRLGFNSITDLSRSIAGLVFDDSFGRDSNRPVIRGQANILGDSGVAFFIDGIYFNGSLADYDVDTIARIEVAKGPQSALYGRNTYSGAINIISKTPTDKWSGRVQADISEGAVYDVTAAISGPIAPGLGIAVGGRFFENEGLFTNTFDNTPIGEQQTRSGYGMLKFDDGGAIRASLRANYNATKDGQPAVFATDANANNCINDFGALYRGNGRYFCGVIQPQPINTDYRRQFSPGDFVGNEIDTLNTGLNIDVDLSDSLTLTSLTGYNNRVATQRTDGDYSPNNFQGVIFAIFPGGPGGLFRTSGQKADFSFSNRSKRTDWSQELRLEYKKDRARILLGGYYFDQDVQTNDNRVLPANAQALADANMAAAQAAACARIPTCRSVAPDTTRLVESRNNSTDNIRNFAIFGSVQYDLTDQFSITAEGRYQEERIRTFAQSASAQAGNIGAPLQAEDTFKKFMPRVTLSYQVTPDNLLYAVYAEGQKPGGFNGASAISVGRVTFGPEDVESFEIGSKNSFLNGGLILNLAFFRNNVTGYQLTQPVQVLNPPLPPVTTSAIENAGDARINGFEIELTARPTREITLTANYAYADAKFRRGFDENEGTLNDVRDDGLTNNSTGDRFPDIPGVQLVLGDITGKRVPRAPQHTAFVDFDYRREIGSSGWTGFAGINAYLISTSFDQVHNLASTGDSVVSDARLGVQNKNFRLQFYVRNLFDEDAVQQIIRYADANRDLRRNFIAGLRPPRRFGVIAEARF